MRFQCEDCKKRTEEVITLSRTIYSENGEGLQPGELPWFTESKNVCFGCAKKYED